MANEFAEISRQLEKYKNVQGLMKYINKESLRKEHQRMNGNKATGVDKVTKDEYETNLEENLDNLIKKMKKLSYKPLPVRRVHIPKGNGKLRPLGILSYEDKLVQGVMTNVLSAIYESIFLETSYGFRPGKDCHQAIKYLDDKIMRGKTNYVVDADIKGFFDNVNHEWLIKFLEHEIKDENFIRYIKRFLISGVIEDLKYYESDKGTPQGGIISPVLANVYLHYVLDVWFEMYIKIKCKGKAHIVRYADDFVACFEYEEDARMYYTELIERLAKFDLEIEQSKSKIIPFGRNTDSKETFDFLGFTHYNNKGRNGYYKCGHRTSHKKSKLKIQAIKEWIMANIHMYYTDVIDKLNLKLRGMFNYYGISDNMPWMSKVIHLVKQFLYKGIKRRSQKSKITWDKLTRMLEYHPLMQPKITHSLWQ
jgi:group II intron reverse transcriptase/maturase